MLWSKRRHSRPGDSSSASQQQRQPQKTAISSSFLSRTSQSSLSLSSSLSSSYSGSGLLNSSRQPLTPLDPQITITAFSGAESNSPIDFSAPLSSHTPNSPSNSPNNAKFSVSRKASLASDQQAIMDSQNQPAGSGAQARSAQTPRGVRLPPNSQTTNNTYRIQAEDLNLYKELSTFQFGAPVSSPSSPSTSPSPTTPSSLSHQATDEPDDLITPPAFSDVTPRPSVVSYAQSTSEISPHQTVAPSDTHFSNHNQHLNMHNQFYGRAPLHNASSHTSQQSQPSHEALPLGPPGASPGAEQGLSFTPANSLPAREHSISPSMPASDTRLHRVHGESTSNTTSQSHSYASSGFGSSSIPSSASASVTSLTSAGQSLSSSLEGEGQSIARTGAPDRDARAASEPEFSSEDEYYDDDDDGSSYYPDEDPRIEVSSVMYEPGHADHFDSFYYANIGGATATGYSFGAGTSTASLSPGRRSSIPISISGMSSSKADVEDRFQSPASRDREGSIATLRRPSRSLDDELRSFKVSDNSTTMVNAASLGSLTQSDPSRSGWTAMQQPQDNQQKGKARDPGVSPHTIPSSATAEPSGDITSLGFDADWGNLRGGITGLTANDIEGLVDPSTSGLVTGRRASNAFNFSIPGITGLSSSSSSGGTANPTTPTAGRARMNSWFSLGRRQSEATVADDAFIRSVGRWDNIYGSRRKDWSFKREKSDAQVPSNGPGKPTDAGLAGNSSKDSEALKRANSSRAESTIGGIFGSRGSSLGPTDRASANVDQERDKDRDKDKDKEKRSKSYPKAMAVGTQEVWRNELVGRYKVDRRAAKPVDPLKPPQQRLHFIHIREPHGQSRPDPPVTVHKHSKAIAFSIGRLHAKPRLRRDTPGSGPNNVPADVRGRSPAYAPRGGMALPRSSMIMLAPRRVQEQYTNTTTTRRLDTHGLLEDAFLGHQASEKPRERSNSRKDADKERDKERRRRAEEDERRKRTRGESSQTNSVNSGTNLMAERDPYVAPPPASAPSLHTYPPAPNDNVRKHSSSHSLRGVPDAALDVAPDQQPLSSQPLNPSAVLEYTQFMVRKGRRRVPHDPLAFDSDEEQGPPSRTPHAEAYGTIDPSSYDRILQHQQHLNSEHSSSLIRRILGLPSLRSTSSSVSPMSSSLDGTFKAPWLTMAPRAKQEEQERVVAILNESFMDVGLLPSRPSYKPKSSGQSQKLKGGKQRNGSSSDHGNSAGVDIFEQVPPDSLYMLLPLWPGETDPVSEKLPGEPKKPSIPIEERQYLLVYYVSDAVNPPEHDKGKHDGEQRAQKKSRSPTTSDETTPRRTYNHHILLSAFHVSARLVGYNELIGSGVRVPDEGLSVTGPMSEALETMPSAEVRHMHRGDFLIGLCQSRDAGMEFFPEGLVKMGLCLAVTPAPRGDTTLMPPDETEEPEEPEIVLSPIGRAAVEMAWVGCMALTSFGPTS